MKSLKVLLVTALAGGISIGAAIFGQRWIGEKLPQTPTGAQRGSTDSLPDFRLSDLSGREVSSASWAGKVLVINYWASWCPPCIREMPTLIRAQQAYDPGQLQVVGIAVDTQEAVEQFLIDHPVNYPILIGDVASVEMSRRLGNRMYGMPFTAIFDRHGRRTFSQVGEVSAATLQAQLAALMPTPPPTEQAGNGG